MKYHHFITPPENRISNFLVVTFLLTLDRMKSVESFENGTSREAFRVMNAASDASSAKSLPFHSLPLMLALSLFINSSTTTQSPNKSSLFPLVEYNPNVSEVPPPTESKISVSEILTKLLQDYDKRVRPNYGSEPVVVDVTMHISSISSMSEVDMDFTVDFYFRQFWNDPRLVIEKFPHNSDQITVGAEVMDKIWMPDTFFPNEKNSYFHHATSTNKFLRIKKNGSLYTSVRLTTTLGCELDLSYFPLDYQNCSMEIESYGYSIQDIVLYWKRDLHWSDQIEFDEKRLKLPQFQVMSAYPYSRLEGTGTGSYSRLSCRLTFRRRMGYYLIQIYIPSSLIVVISWVSFWLNRESTPARVSLGVTTVLTMTTLMSSTNASLPKVSYAKGIDVYLGTCFVMVFASLLEYATVGYSSKRMKMRAAKAHGRPMPRHIPSGSIMESQSHTAGSPTRALQQVMGSNHSLHHHPEHAALTCRNSVRSPGTEVREKYSEYHGSLHGRRSVEFRYKSWGEDQMIAHGQSEGYTGSGNGPPDVESGMCRSYSLPKVSPKKKKEFKSSAIDKWSRGLFPAVFVMFNFVYWFTYINISVVPGGSPAPGEFPKKTA